jgi:hypothetical protein
MDPNRQASRRDSLIAALACALVVAFFVYLDTHNAYAVVIAASGMFVIGLLLVSQRREDSWLRRPLQVGKRRLFVRIAVVGLLFVGAALALDEPILALGVAILYALVWLAIFRVGRRIHH